MIDEYLILEVDENKNNYKAALFTADEAVAHVKRYCENGDIDYQGIDGYRYLPRWIYHHTAFLVVTRVYGTTRIGNFWNADEESTEVTDVHPNNPDI